MKFFNKQNKTAKKIVIMKKNLRHLRSYEMRLVEMI